MSDFIERIAQVLGQVLDRYDQLQDGARVRCDIWYDYFVKQWPRTPDESAAAIDETKASHPRLQAVFFEDAKRREILLKAVGELSSRHFGMLARPLPQVLEDVQVLLDFALGKRALASGQTDVLSQADEIALQAAALVGATIAEDLHAYMLRSRSGLAEALEALNSFIIAASTWLLCLKEIRMTQRRDSTVVSELGAGSDSQQPDSGSGNSIFSSRRKSERILANKFIGSEAYGLGAIQVSTNQQGMVTIEEKMWTLRDVGAGGMGFLAPASTAPQANEEILIEIRARRIIARVVWRVPRDPDGTIPCRFGVEWVIDQDRTDHLEGAGDTV